MCSTSQAIARVGSDAAFSWFYDFVAGESERHHHGTALAGSLGFFHLDPILHLILQWQMKRLLGLAGRVQRQMCRRSTVSKLMGGFHGDDRGEQRESVGTKCGCARRAIGESMAKSLLRCRLANERLKGVGQPKTYIRDQRDSSRVDCANQARRQARQRTVGATWSYLGEDEGHSFDVEAEENASGMAVVGRSTATTVVEENYRQSRLAHVWQPR